jgi:hypothetical protein
MIIQQCQKQNVYHVSKRGVSSSLLDGNLLLQDCQTHLAAILAAHKS